MKQSVLSCVCGKIYPNKYPAMIPLKVYNYIAKGDFVTYVGFTYMGSRWLLMLDLKIFVWINVTKKQMNRTGNITPSLANI